MTRKEADMSDTYLPGDTQQRIQDLIKSRKITQAELAEKVGLSSSTLSRYLQGRTTNLGDGFIISPFAVETIMCISCGRVFILILTEYLALFQPSVWLYF